MKDNDLLVWRVANRWAKQCPEPVEDLAQIGRIGLLKAVERYDPGTGNAFSSFAVPYINGEIQHHLRARWGLLKIPQVTFEEAAKVRRLVRQMAKLGRQVDEVTAAAAVGITAERWAWISEAVQRRQLASLDEVLELADRSDEGDRQALHQTLTRAIGRLPSMQRRCVTGRYFRGLADDAIAKAEGISPTEVEAAIEAALTGLKATVEGLLYVNA